MKWPTAFTIVSVTAILACVLIFAPAAVVSGIMSAFGMLFMLCLFLFFLWSFTD